ncbi:MAG: phosphoribosyltransferase family protein [Dehalococcoidia bacterium]
MSDSPSAPFRDRTDAGRKLAERLDSYRNGNVVLAVPRGGIPVGIEIAERLGANLDVVVVRKIPIRDEPEAGYGAVTEDGVIVLNEPLVSRLGYSRRQIEEQAERIRREIERRTAFFRHYLKPVSVEGKTAVLVDDGLASGFTMIAAVESIRQRQAERIVVAVPTASERACELVEPKVDELICLTVGHGACFAVASYYASWHDLTDEEVASHLESWQEKREGYPSEEV